MIKSPKAKGNRTEKAIVAELEKAGIQARRTPMSGALGIHNPAWAHDITITHAGFDLTVEVKARANGEGFATLRRWKGAADLLILRADRAEADVVMSMGLFVQLMAALKEKHGVRS